MKRFIIFLLLVVMPLHVVYASNGFEYSSVTDKCHIVSRNTTEIPIKIVVLNDGMVSSLISPNKFGMIENLKEYKYEIIKLKSDVVDNVRIDTLRDGNSMSNLYYTISEDATVKKRDIFASFNIKVEFNGEYPSTLNILGNEIVLGDKTTCEIINGYKTEVMNREVNRYIEDEVSYVSYIIISSLIFLASLFILISVIVKSVSEKRR